MDNPIHTFKPLPDKTLELSVDTVDTKTPSSKNSKSLMMSCTTEIEVSTATTTKNLRTFEKGDRVVIKDVGGMFQGVRGEISDVWHGRAGETYIVRFDKPVRNIRQTECEGSNLMKL